MLNLNIDSYRSLRMKMRGGPVVIIVTTYGVDKKIYHDTETRHDISLITMEYVHGNDILVCLRIGGNTGVRLNELLRSGIAGGVAIHGERYLFMKTYRRLKPKPITRSSFDEKLKRFDISKTSIETEILEIYAYTGKNGRADAVQLVIREKGNTMTAVIDFRNSEHQENFAAPPYLLAVR